MSLLPRHPLRKRFKLRSTFLRIGILATIQSDIPTGFRKPSNGQERTFDRCPKLSVAEEVGRGLRLP